METGVENGARARGDLSLIELLAIILIFILLASGIVLTGAGDESAAVARPPAVRGASANR